MRDFSKVSPGVWHCPKFLALPSDSARYLYLYVRTNGHQNSSGCYRLPIGYACTDLGWSLKQYEEQLGLLIAPGLIQFDKRTQELFVANWFDDNPPMNESHRRGIENQLKKVESGDLRQGVELALDAAWEKIMAGRANLVLQRRSLSTETAPRSNLLDTPHYRGRN